MADNSSNTPTARTLADSELLKALRELANLRLDAEAFERFCKRWPELSYLPDEDPPTGPEELPPKFWIMCERREDLRGIWVGDSSLLRALLLRRISHFVTVKYDARLRAKALVVGVVNGLDHVHCLFAEVKIVVGLCV